jgi:hypothetical protein
MWVIFKEACIRCVSSIDRNFRRGSEIFCTSRTLAGDFSRDHFRGKTLPNYRSGEETGNVLCGETEEPRSQTEFVTRKPRCSGVPVDDIHHLIQLQYFKASIRIISAFPIQCERVQPLSATKPYSVGLRRFYYPLAHVPSSNTRSSCWVYVFDDCFNRGRYCGCLLFFS